MKEVNEIHSSGNHITGLLSRSDLIQLGGYAAVEYCGGPSMIFRMGRTDVLSEAEATSSVEETAVATQDAHRNNLIVNRLQSEAAGLSHEEFVALMGMHTLGFTGGDKKGIHNRWTSNPYVFDNTYF